MKNMMRILFILALSILLVSVVVAAPQTGTLKAILVIQDHYNDPELNNISDSTQMDYDLVNKFLDTLSQKNVIAVEKTMLHGENATSKNILTLIKNISVTSSDVLFFYFSGHGGMDKKGTFILTSECKFLYRSDLESQIKSKPARLSLVFTDACSSSIEAIGGRGSFNKNNKDRENAFIEIYKNLFYNYKGLMYVTAATEGEYAWGGKDGGAFTKSLFYEVLLQDPKLTWEDNYNEAKKRTQEKFTYLKNMGFLNASDLKDLEKRGIKSQTPKAYSLPMLLDTVAVDNQVNNNQQNINNNSSNNNNNSGTTASQNVKALVKNLTQKTITFYVDNNVSYDDKNWSWDNCVKKVVKPSSSVTLEDTKPLIVFFDNGKKKSLQYQLTSGSYTFENEKDGSINMYTISSTTSNQTDTTADDNSNQNNNNNHHNDKNDKNNGSDKNNSGKTNSGDVGIGSLFGK